MPRRKRIIAAIGLILFGMIIAGGIFVPPLFAQTQHHAGGGEGSREIGQTLLDLTSGIQDCKKEGESIFCLHDNKPIQTCKLQADQSLVCSVIGLSGIQTSSFSCAANGTDRWNCAVLANNITFTFICVGTGNCIINNTNQEIINCIQQADGSKKCTVGGITIILNCQKLVDGKNDCKGKSIIGPPGTNGKDGKDGGTGYPGIPGLPGLQGQPGNIGLPGLDGATGRQGDQGSAGPTGPAGPKGDTGAKGENGAQGQKGDKGDTGSRGDNGSHGSKGDKGDKGEKGEKGSNSLIVERVMGDTIYINNRTYSSATASCPDGTHITGGGYRTVGGLDIPENVTLLIIRNSTIDDDTWEVKAAGKGANQGFGIQAFAYCASLK